MGTPIKNMIVFDSANRIDAVESPDLNNYNYSAVLLVVDITGFTGGTNATFTIQGKDFVSGKYFDILSSAAKTATGTFTLSVCPEIAVVSNSTASAILPKQWRVKVAKTGTFTNLTYSVSATLVEC